MKMYLPLTLPLLVPYKVVDQRQRPGALLSAFQAYCVGLYGGDGPFQAHTYKSRQ